MLFGLLPPPSPNKFNKVTSGESLDWLETTFTQYDMGHMAQSKITTFTFSFSKVSMFIKVSGKQSQQRERFWEAHEASTTYLPTLHR